MLRLGTAKASCRMSCPALPSTASDSPVSTAVETGTSMSLSSRPSTRELLEDLLSRRILVLDGAMGTMIYAHQPKEEDFRGSRFRQHPVDLMNCTEVMALTQPKMIEDIHRAYLEAGADIIETDTFNSNRVSMA